MFGDGAAEIVIPGYRVDFEALIGGAFAKVLAATLGQIERIADYLEHPATLFYEPGFLREGASNCLYYRKRKTLPAKVLSRVKRHDDDAEY